MRKLIRDKNQKRKIRVRSKMSGTSDKPRMSVFRSNKYISVQLIDDEKGKTIISFSEKKLNKKDTAGKTKTEKAQLVGEHIASLAKKKKIEKAVFDRGMYKYHGRVKAVAEGARKKGLKL